LAAFFASRTLVRRADTERVSRTLCATSSQTARLSNRAASGHRAAVDRRIFRRVLPHSASDAARSAPVRPSAASRAAVGELVIPLANHAALAQHVSGIAVAAVGTRETTFSSAQAEVIFRAKLSTLPVRGRDGSGWSQLARRLPHLVLVLALARAREARGNVVRRVCSRLTRRTRLARTAIDTVLTGDSVVLAACAIFAGRGVSVVRLADAPVLTDR